MSAKAGPAFQIGSISSALNEGAMLTLKMNMEDTYQENEVRFFAGTAIRPRRSATPSVSRQQK